MEQTTKEKKAEALKQLMAGKIDIDQLKDKVQSQYIQFINLEEFEGWLKQSYPDEAAVVIEDLIQSVRDKNEMAKRTTKLTELFGKFHTADRLTIESPLKG